MFLILVFIIGFVVGHVVSTTIERSITKDLLKAFHIHRINIISVNNEVVRSKLLNSLILDTDLLLRESLYKALYKKLTPYQRTGSM